MPIVACAECKSDMDKLTGEVNRAKKLGRDLYCSPPCMTTALSRKRTKHSLSYRNRQREKLAGRPAPDKCEVCGGSESLNRGKTNRMHFDHCHSTGKFRGWLCASCNRVLGLVKDSPDRLRSLAGYLEKHHAN